MKWRFCHPVICCGTYWTPLNTVLMQGKKPKHFEWFDFSSRRKTNSELWWSPPGAKRPSSWERPIEGLRRCSHHLNPVVPVDTSRRCLLANIYFVRRGEKKKEERTLWIWRSKPLFKGFIHIVSRARDPGPCSSCVWDASRWSDVHVKFFWQDVGEES